MPSGRVPILVARPELIEEIREAIESVYYTHLAANLCGVRPESVEKWLKLGELHLKSHLENEECNSECAADNLAYAKFYITVKAEQAKFSRDNLDSIKKHRPKTFAAAAWLQERTQPEDFGFKIRNEVTGANGGPIVHKVLPSIEQREKILRAANKAIEMERNAEGKYLPVSNDKGSE